MDDNPEAANPEQQKKNILEIQVRYRSSAAFDDSEHSGELAAFGNLFGTSATIMLRHVRTKRLAEYHRALFSNDEEALAEFLCRQQAGWGALLDPDSLQRVLDAGQDLNQEAWSYWFKRVLQRNEMAQPGSTDAAAKAIAIAVEEITKEIKGARGASSE